MLFLMADITPSLDKCVGNTFYLYTRKMSHTRLSLTYTYNNTHI